MAALAALLTLLALTTGGHLDVEHVGPTVRFTDLYGFERDAPAALECPSDDSGPNLWVGDAVPLEVLVHELAHAWDCLDDGAMNASLIRGWRPSARPAWASDYCWDTDAEWFACLVGRSLR